MNRVERNNDLTLRGPLADDSGLSLIELVIGCAISALVLIGLLAVLSAGTRAESDTQKNHAAFRELRDAVDRAIGDIRQATDVNPASSATILDIQTLVQGAPTRMIYDVDGTSFRRTVCTSFDFAAPCGGTAAALANNVIAARAFCYDAECLAAAPAPSLSLLRITIAGEPASRGARITVATDVQLRNL